MCILIDAASKSGLKRDSQATRFFNDFKTNVEPYFDCEDLGAKPLSGFRRLSVTLVPLCCCSRQLHKISQN